MAVNGRGSNPNKEPVMGRISKILEGALPENYSGEGALASLFGKLIRRFTKSPLVWKQGIEALVKHKEERGELEGEKVQSKRGNLSSNLAKPVLTWKCFIDGLKLLIFIPGSKIFYISLTVTVKRRVTKNTTETIVEEIVLHDEEG